MSAGRLSSRCDFSIWGWHLGRDGRKLGSVGAVGQSISWWPLQHGGLSGWLDLYHGSSVLLWAKAELHGLLWLNLKSHMVSLLLYSIGQSHHKPAYTQRRGHCPAPQWEGRQRLCGHVKSATAPLNFLFGHLMTCNLPCIIINHEALSEPREEQTSRFYLCSQFWLSSLGFLSSHGIFFLLVFWSWGWKICLLT